MTTKVTTNMLDQTGSYTFSSNVTLTGNTTTSGNLVASGNVTLTSNTTASGNLVASGNVTLGSIANVRITGGNNGQAILTDGTGNLSFGSAGIAAAKVVGYNLVFGG